MAWSPVGRGPHKGGRILLPQTKNSEVHLKALAQQALAAVPGRPSPRIWSSVVYPSLPRMSRSPSCWRAARWGSLTFALTICASWMRVKGADNHTVALLLGHKDMHAWPLAKHLPGFSPARSSCSI
jgi:hypothetical protein